MSLSFWILMSFLGQQKYFPLFLFGVIAIISSGDFSQATGDILFLNLLIRVI